MSSPVTERRRVVERVPIDVLWCSNRRTNRVDGWSFPPAVEHHLRRLTKGKRVCQLFGGKSRWGVRLDIDPIVNPHVLGDAWLPPFKRDAFDVVILDPPYVSINQQMKQQLLRAASFIAREHLIWFHTLWIASDSALRLERGWLVRVGDQCSVRCIQLFRTPAQKTIPRRYFDRGPAVRYNRWLSGEMPLPFHRTEDA